MFLIRLSLCVQLSVNTVVLCAKAHVLPLCGRDFCMLKHAASFVGIKLDYINCVLKHTSCHILWQGLKPRSGSDVLARLNGKIAQQFYNAKARLLRFCRSSATRINLYCYIFEFCCNSCLFKRRADFSCNSV